MSMPHPERRIKFDATINLGHILTFIGFLIGGLTAWTNLNNRVLTLEDAKLMQVEAAKQEKVMQVMVDHRQDMLIETTAKIQREDNKEINAKLDRLIERTMKK